MAQWPGLPAVVVSRAGLGTINHTLLTIEALRRSDVPVATKTGQWTPTIPADAVGRVDWRAMMGA